MRHQSLYMRNQAIARILLVRFGIFLMMHSWVTTKQIFIYMDIMTVAQGSCPNSWIKETEVGAFRVVG